MKRALQRLKNDQGVWHDADGIRVDGTPDGVRGDLSGVRGDLDACELTDDERERGVSVDQLVNDTDKAKETDKCKSQKAR